MDRIQRAVRIMLLLTLALVVLIGVSACGAGEDEATTDEPAATESGSDAEGTTDAEQEDPAVALIETKCSMCHATDRVYSSEKTRDEWIATIDRMETNGLVITDDEYSQILDYLAPE